MNAFDPDAYIFQYVRDVQGEKCDLQDILDGMWLTIVTLTSVGYGRFYPRNISGQLLSIFVAILGAFYMAMPLAIVGTTFYNAYKLKEEARARIHVKRKFRKGVNRVRDLIRRGRIMDDEDQEMHSGLPKADVEALGEYIQWLGPREAFVLDHTTLVELRRRHMSMMHILGRMLSTLKMDDVGSKGMFE